MEACVQKPKEKKQRLKSEPPNKSKKKCISVAKVEEPILEDKLKLKISAYSEIPEKVEVKDSSAQENASENKFDSKRGDIDKNMPSFSTTTQCEISDSKVAHDVKAESTNEVLSSLVDNPSDQSSMKFSVMEYSSLASENHLFNSQCTLNKVKQPQHIYPDLKSIQFCEQMHGIICSQTLVKTYIDEFGMKTVVQANEAFENFIKVTNELDKHPFYEMIHQYRKAKHSCIKLRSRMKYLNSDLKRKKDSLWKSVKKEVSAKGKCHDGSTVNISHSYIIKELDQDKFDEVVRSLKEIEESVSSDAFNFYLEELMKLRIERYLCNLVKEDHIVFEGSVNSSLPEDIFISSKKTISILFDFLRQNAPDKNFVETCRKWLTSLVSKLLQNGKFDDSIFIINHVIRCPSGIENWATQFVHVHFDMCDTEKSSRFGCVCCQKFLLVLYLVLNPAPHKHVFLKYLKNSASDSFDGNFTVLDSDGEEEEVCEMFRNWSEDDILSLLSQIPVRSLYSHLLLDNTDNTVTSTFSEEKILKMFAFSTVLIDILFTGMETHCSEDFPRLFESISNLIRHILSYVSSYWANHVNYNDFKISIQAVYDRFFFHIIFQVSNILNTWMILSSLPYEYVSKKMLWNIMWIFFCPGRSEEEIFTEKDIERKIQDESAHVRFISHLKEVFTKNVVHVLNAFEKIALSSNTEEDFLKFLVQEIFQITFVETSLRDNLSKEGCIILSSIVLSYPYLLSVLLKEIDASNDAANFSISLFKTLSLYDWIPEDADVSIISSWLLSNPLSEAKSCLARLILSKMNWEFTKQGLLVLPETLHNRIAMLVTDAYLKFDSSCNEWLVSRGIKQILQFTAIINDQRSEEGFVHWAWNVLFSLKLHPLDRRCPPWIFIYDGCIDDCDKFINEDISLEPLLSAFQNKHPAGCYLMIVMTDVGHNMKNLVNTGLDCLSFLVESEQYMVAIRSLYYIMPFFVKNPEQLLEDFRFIKSINDLITADMTYASSFFGEPVIGAVLQNMADMMKHQIYQASESTVECAAPLLKLWIKILMKIFHYDKSSKNKLKNSAKQICFLLDVLVKVSYLHSYTRECTLDLLSTFCKTSILPSTNHTVWKRLFQPTSPMYAILNKNIVPEYPWLAWFVLSSEMKQKSVLNVWETVQEEMVKQKDATVADCLKRASVVLKIDQPPLGCLPIYRWASQAIEVPASHAISPLLWQQFFMYFFQKVQLPNSQCYSSIGRKYFKYGSCVQLMQQIKKYFSDAEKYYRDCLNLSVCHDKSSAQTNENINGSTFHFNLLKLFCAFQLWINDESLHESKLCLSALEPKYCPYRLELILKGDQNAWFDMVPETYLKDELDQKILSWYKKKAPYVVPKLSLVNRESLSKQLYRHLENYEDFKRDLSDLPVSSSVHDENNCALASTDELVQHIENNQSVIFNKAKYFSEQMKKMKQLNFNFINWVPQEYKVEDFEVTEQKVCHKGMNGCSGAAHFKLKTQKCTKNERICERIYRNREDFVILQDQLIKLSVSDLCDASLLIENYIRSLSSKMKAAKSEEADLLRKMGVAVFYHQIDAIDKVISSVVEYSPSRLFYSSIIESLGREFIDGHSSELQGLAKCILNHPEAGSLALPLFNPNKSCVSYFKLAYETLTLAIGKYSPSTLLALYSKIDFSMWLRENTPNSDCIITIFDYVCNGLLACGFSPCAEIYPVFEILKKHFKIILLHMFPELFLKTVYFLLNGVENKNLCVDVYYETFFCFGCSLFSEKTTMDDIEAGLKKFAQNQQLSPNQQIFVSVPRLNLMQVKHASQTLHKHFMEKRQICDLYKNYSIYIQPLGIFLAIISYSLVALQLEEIMTKNQRDMSNFWKEFHSPFWPWLHPFEKQHGFIFPWTDGEVNIAHYMFQVFTICMKHFHEKLLRSGIGESILSYLWNDYVQIYVASGLRHYSAAVCHSELLQLPWHEFYPSAHDIEGMCKILQSNLNESKQFLSKISLQIPWFLVMKNISLTKTPGYVGKVLATHGKLMIISQLNNEETEPNLCPNIFKELDSLSWHFLSVEDTEELLNLYYSSFDPLLFLNKLQNNPDVHILQFLRLVCCMIPNANREEYSNSKSVLYVQKFACALSTCLSKKNFELKSEDNFKTVLPTLLSEVDNIICNGINPDVQMNCALPLVKETVTILNTLPEGELDLVALTSIKSWINSNTQSPLLLPCLKVASCYLNSVLHMVSLSEGCISARFSSEILDPCESKHTWQLISSFFQLPSRFCDDFVKECVEQNAFLTLYCYILQVIPQSNSIERKGKLFKRMIQWIRECNLSPPAEAKFLLLWDKILELSITLVLQDESQLVTQELMSFCWKLGILAEDRSSSGFFGTIGFGQTSSLSVSFRFLCRVMSAFLQYQIPDNAVICIEPISPGYLSSDNDNKKDLKTSKNPTPSSSALNALENLKALLKKKSYTALQSQIDYAVTCISGSSYNLPESRKLLKYFAVVLYPKESYLSSLDF